MKSPLTYQFQSFEKIPVSIWENDVTGSKFVAEKIAESIREREKEGRSLVLGLATGSSPINLYRELIRMHKEDGLSFKHVISFNLDEYYPMKPDARQSYVKFMWHYLFDHIDILPENVHIPDGTTPLEDVDKFCLHYEQKIKDSGGIDIQILGIGRTGHIGFNEPASRRDSRTRLVRLDNLTMRDAGKDFIDAENVPFRAITMGIRSIMEARTVYLLAWGQHKSKIVQRAVEGEISSQIPCTFLQAHDNVEFIVDDAAAEELTRVMTPWLVGMCEWDEDLICRAVVWLSQRVNRPVLKLTDEEYKEHGLGDLFLKYESMYDMNISIFNRLQHTITGWPGGKPKADDSTRPERAIPDYKRALIFSPHPDDDVISMGGTFMRLVKQGHEVHVAYQTSGNIAVYDHDALRFAEFYGDFTQYLDSDSKYDLERQNEIIKFLRSKSDVKSDTRDVRTIKGLIRKGEARAGARYCGLEDDHIHFLNMPFYETGETRKSPITDEDVSIVVDLMKKIRPHQVYAAGDLADPHGTHRVCLDAILSAFKELKNEDWIKDCWLWLYRGAWHEWRVDEIQMAVPISPSEVLKKRKAIFMHQSQKDRPPFPGEDEREFWKRAEDRNKATAEVYRKLGLAEYEAMEAFRRYIF